MTEALPQNPLGTKRISSLLFSFGAPSILAMLISSLYNIVDQIFIGWGIGYLGNAATTVAFPFTTICLALALLLGVGSAANYSLELGRGHPDKAAEIVGNALILMVVFGVVYFAFGELCMSWLLPIFGGTPENIPYAEIYSDIILIGLPFLIVNNGMSNLIRADGSPKFSMTCMIIGAIINTVLDPIFIFVFHWGMAGAAWATIIGQIVSCLVACTYIRRFQHIHFSRKCIHFRLPVALRICELGASSSLNQVAILFVQIALNNSLVYYGGLSIYGANIPIASAGIVMKLNGLFMAFMVGLSQGAQPIIGYNYGARKYDRVRKTLLEAFLAVVVAGTLVELLFQFASRPCILIFGNGEELYLEFASRFLRVYMMMVPIVGIQALSSNYFSAIGQPVKGIILSLSRSILFFMPLIYFLPQIFGLDGILLVAPIADAVSVLLSLVLVSFSFKKLRQMEQEVQIRAAVN